MYYQIDRENKTIPITLEAIPKNWANISNMDCLNDEELAKLGYVKGTPPFDIPAFTPGKQCLCLTAAVQDDGSVAEFWNLKDYTPEEVSKLLEDAKSVIRQQRNPLLAATDWAMLLDTPLSETAIAEMKVYRQALRDMPATLTPLSPVWPTKPAALGVDISKV